MFDSNGLLTFYLLLHVVECVKAAGGAHVEDAVKSTVHSKGRQSGHQAYLGNGVEDPASLQHMNPDASGTTVRSGFLGLP